MTTATVWKIIEIIDDRIILKSNTEDYCIRKFLDVPRIKIEKEFGKTWLLFDGNSFMLDIEPEEAFQIIRKTLLERSSSTKIAQLEAKIEKLDNEIRYMPGHGTEYLKAKGHFENNQ